MNPPPTLTPEENEKRVAELRKELDRLASSRKSLKPLYRAPFTLLMGAVLLTRQHLPLFFLSKLLFAILLVSAGLTPIVLVGLREQSRLRENECWQKVFENNVQLPLDLLIEACQTLKGDLQLEAEERLTTALNSSQAAEYTQLPGKDKRWLVSRLVEDSPALQSAMLDTLEHFGGEEAVGGLNALINQRQMPWTDPPRYDFGDGISLRTKRVLAIVEARVKAAKRGETLLRPSVPPVAPDTYLRPSQEVSNAEDEKQLLRASVGETEE